MFGIIPVFMFCFFYQFSNYFRFVNHMRKRVLRAVSCSVINNRSEPKYIIVKKNEGKLETK